jgi:hypothetical protein
LIICGFAGFVVYPHRVTLVLLSISFLVAGSTKGNNPYDFIALGGIFGLPAGALISRILYWLKVIK